MREPGRPVVLSNHDDADLRSPGFSRIEEAAGIGRWEDDLVQGVSWWSDGLYRLFGLKPGERPATVQTLEGIIPPSDLAAIARAKTSRRLPLIHAKTVKGMGWEPADHHPFRQHFSFPFDTAPAERYQLDYAAWAGLPFEVTNRVGISLVLIPPVPS